MGREGVVKNVGIYLVKRQQKEREGIGKKWSTLFMDGLYHKTCFNQHDVLTGG